MGFSAGGGAFSTGPKMNVTPLIDVLLVLIIVFMIVVIEQRPTGLQTELPQQSKSVDHIPPPQATIVIQIRHPKPGLQPSHPEVMVNEEAVAWDHLPDRLRDIFAIRVERIAYLKADDDIDFQGSRRDRDCEDRRGGSHGVADRGREAFADGGLERVSSVKTFVGEN